MFCDVEPISGDVIITGHDVTQTKRHVILRVRPNDGKIWSVGGIDEDVVGEVFDGVSCYDAKNEIEWLQIGGLETREAVASGSGNVRRIGIIEGIEGTVDEENVSKGSNRNSSLNVFDIFGFSITNGSRLYSLNNPLEMETMRFDEPTGLIYGIGIHNDERVLVTLDGSTGDFKIVQTVPNYFVMLSSSIAAIDSTRRQFFAIFERKPTSIFDSSNPFDLISIDLANGAVVTHTTLCKLRTSCPWGLHVF